MKAIILAAGKGSRLQPLTNDIPKCMVKLFGKTLIERQVEIYQKCGIEDITIVTGYKGEMIKIPNVNFVKNENFDTTNMNESLFCAHKKINGTVIISYSDIIFEKKIIEQLIKNFKKFGIAVNLEWKKNYDGRSLHPLSEAENILLENEKILKIQKNISDSFSNQQIGEFMGIMILSGDSTKKMLEKYEYLKINHKGIFHSSNSLKEAYITDMLQELINSGIMIKPIFVKGKWCEIDTIEDLKRAEKVFND